jgi:GntR family transcriptional regulator/MocR family aminotransferase
VSTLGYRDPLGERELREALADHLGLTRGVVADPEQIAVVQGTGQGVDLLLRVLRARGASTVAVEDPSHALQQARVTGQGLRLVGRPLDREGMVVDGLDADAVLVTPAHQFPTGCVLSGDRRRQLLAWAEAKEALVAEDDYDAEFRYDRQPVRALQGLAPERVVQLGTVSKTLAPALRLGWLVAPASLVDELRREKELADDFSPALDQLALAEFLRRGEYHRHVRRARKTYRARRDLLLEALARYLPELKVDGIAAGMHVVVRLPDDADDAAVAQAARRAGIKVPAMSAFAVERRPRPALVVGYGRLHESAAVPATRLLAKVVHEQLAAQPGRARGEDAKGEWTDRR